MAIDPYTFHEQVPNSQKPFGASYLRMLGLESDIFQYCTSLGCGWESSVLPKGVVTIGGLYVKHSVSPFYRWGT